MDSQVRNGMADETDYLLSSANNARALLESIREADGMAPDIRVLGPEDI
jgi:PHD/YefM family antitoxin component YafN of YafNO toxin-antitoxin module